MIRKLLHAVASLNVGIAVWFWGRTKRDEE
jgi:hypothetical protein